MTGEWCATHSGEKCTSECKLHTDCGLHEHNSEMLCKAPSFCRCKRGGGREREKGVTRIQFITSEAAGTQPPIAHNGASVQNLFVQHYFAQTNFAR